MASDDGKSALNQQLCKDFADITGTDPELALYYLEQKSWKLEDAVNMFFDSNRPSRPDDDTSQTVEGVESAKDEGGGSQGNAPAKQEAAVTTDLPSQASSSEVNDLTSSSKRFRLITWNIDGLDQSCLNGRAQAICRILNSFNPDVIFLQEVIPETCKLICSQLSNYKPFPASDHAYFTLILLKKSTVTCLSSKIESFPDSAMLRALQIVDCKCAGLDLRLMSSHLESTGQPKAIEERQKQFSRAVYLMKTAPAEHTVFFGGDTNLRDKEVARFGVPSYIHDVWEMCGSPSGAKYTWDLTQNDNLDWPHPNRPRLRFDRLFLRHPKTAPRLEPKTFNLLGTERLPCHKFPSDHWGIVCDFEVTSS
ncbi:tyrosyl-DNA phosphodiesterase 2-like [Patiria miniata]|uniref:Tyrosyl-DNA phosphodiesterase 2 n=1 Tax=Patiria miniata TaxID=46514 RepID=A0A913ZKX2_PATMI|nr:tyrosyl-DNA phosphodiesterase 2-like [Patiria miniata]